MDLLRALALAFPVRYRDLHALTDADAELDFFNNVAHLQMHRRSRAFKRLANVRTCCLALQQSRDRDAMLMSASSHKESSVGLRRHHGGPQAEGWTVAVQACQNGVMTSTTLMGVAVPLLQQAIIEGDILKAPPSHSLLQAAKAQRGLQKGLPLSHHTLNEKLAIF